MTVSSTDRTNGYVGDGIQTVFPYTFYILRASDLSVFFNGAEQMAGFTVDGVGNQGGGNVTFDVAPADLTDILLSRIVPLTQDINYQAFDPFPAQTNENGLDLLTMADQQLQGQIDVLAGTGVGVVSSVFGRDGAVVAAPGDYTNLTALTIDAGPFILANGAAQGYIFANSFTSLSLRGDTPGAGVSLELFPADGDGTDGASFVAYAVRTGPNDLTDVESVVFGWIPGRARFELTNFAAGAGVLHDIALNATGGPGDQLVLEAGGDVRLDGLAGAGTRTVVADPNGVLSAP